MAINNILDFFLHLDKYLSQFIGTYGPLTYGILFVVIFLETGLIVTPFLPGDSLIFVAAALASQGFMNIYLLIVLLSLAAIFGDSLNYSIGKYFGNKFIHNKKLVKREYLERTEEFYLKHGGKTIIFARFIPIIRTFAPFVAGISKMNYRKFLIYNVIGGVAWVGFFAIAGYFFGTISVIQKNLTWVIIIIIGASLIPPAVEYLIVKIRHRKEKNLDKKIYSNLKKIEKSE